MQTIFISAMASTGNSASPCPPEDDSHDSRLVVGPLKPIVYIMTFFGVFHFRRRHKGWHPLCFLTMVVPFVYLVFFLVSFVTLVWFLWYAETLSKISELCVYGLIQFASLYYIVFMLVLCSRRKGVSVLLDRWPSGYQELPETEGKQCLWDTTVARGITLCLLVLYSMFSFVVIGFGVVVFVLPCPTAAPNGTNTTSGAAAIFGGALELALHRLVNVSVTLGIAMNIVMTCFFLSLCALILIEVRHHRRHTQRTPTSPSTDDLCENLLHRAGMVLDLFHTADGLFGWYITFNICFSVLIPLGIAGGLRNESAWAGPWLISLVFAIDGFLLVLGAGLCNFQV